MSDLKIANIVRVANEELRNGLEHNIGNALKASGLAQSEQHGMSMVHIELNRGDTYLLVYSGGVIAGFVSWRVEGELRHGVAELCHIGVIPKFQRKKLGQRLCGIMVDDAVQYYHVRKYTLRKIFLKTHATNIEAHRLYQKVGMQHEATLKDHFHPGVDEYIFSLFIKSKSG